MEPMFKAKETMVAGLVLASLAAGNCFLELSACTAACDAEASSQCMSDCAALEKTCRAQPKTTEKSGVFAGKVEGKSRMECVNASFDPQDYNWFAFRNLCGEGIKIHYLRPGQFEGKGCTVPPGGLCRTGLTRRDLADAQAGGGMRWSVCEAGFVARGATGDLFRYADTAFHCIKEP
jgi:hypothetical protein